MKKLLAISTILLLSTGCSVLTTPPPSHTSEMVNATVKLCGEGVVKIQSNVSDFEGTSYFLLNCSMKDEKKEQLVNNDGLTL